MKKENYEIVDVFKYYSMKLSIYKSEKGYTINKIDFYDSIEELKKKYKTLIKKMNGKISY